jgi:cytosine/adenosine deaminase-related metal-dependent hydrolase
VVSVSPYSELRIGFGVTKILEYLDNGVTLGLSVDTTPLTGNCDMFGIMKVVQNIENGRAERNSNCRRAAWSNSPPSRAPARSGSPTASARSRRASAPT